MADKEPRYINPLTDFGFKRIFGTEKMKDVLVLFLNQLLPAKHQIQEIEFSKTERLGMTDYDRKAIFDLSCTSAGGERFIVEMQKVKQKYFKDRSLYYASFLIQEQGQKGDHWNFKLNPVYSISILDFEFDDHKHDENLLHHVTLKDQNGVAFYDKLEFVYIELPKFSKAEPELNNLYEKFLYVLRYLPDLQNRPMALQEKVFGKIFSEAEIAKFTPIERNSYENSLKTYRDIQNSVETSREEGREETKISIAKDMKTSGYLVEEIIRLTGLTEAEIEAL